MSFHDLEVEHIVFEDSFLRGHIPGCKRLVMAMDRCDTSWNIVFQMTLSVMCVLNAALYGVDQDKTRSFLEGMMGLWVMMTNNWTINMGGITRNEFSHRQLQVESKLVDNMGQALVNKVNTESQFIMELLGQFLGGLPNEWASQLKLTSNVVFSFTHELQSDDASYLGKLVVEEQYRLVEAMAQSISDALSDDTFLVTATEWVGIARDMFNQETSMGQQVDNQMVMSSIIKKIGFPIMEI